ncbi:MAG: ATP-binding protein [Myxococcales bacterium]|nr:ATP-binding protein [Myxococcales bacterium]
MPTMDNPLHLPGTLGLSWLESAGASTWRWEPPVVSPRVVDAAEGGLRFVEPVGAAMISAWAAHRAAAGIQFAVAANVRTPHGYAAGVLSRLAGHVATAVPGRPVVPAQVVHSEAEFGTIGAAVERLTGSDENTAQAMIQCVEDLIRNVFHHAKTPHGAHWAASIDARQRLVRIGVADCGQGIAADIRASFVGGSELDDAAAVTVALEPRVSGSEDPGRNMGVGLHVVRQLSLAGHGRFWLLTRRVRVLSSTDQPETFAPRVETVEGDWQGTAVAVTLQLDAMPAVGEVLRRLRDEIEGRGPHHRSLQFFRRLGAADAARTILAIAPDTGVMAYDRERALRVGREDVTLLLARGPVALTWDTTKVATQAFAYALLYPAVQAYGLTAFERLQFIGCSPQVTTVLRMVASVLLTDHDMRETPVRGGPA